MRGTIVSEQTIEQLVEALSKLTVLDMAKLKTALEDKWGVKAAAAAPVMMAAAPAAAEAAAEATDFQITLEGCPADKKMGVIKVIREITSLGLKEAKDLVDGAPKVVKESAPKAEANEIMKKLTEAGAQVKLKGL